MKKLFYLLPVIIFGFIIMTGQKADEPEKWSQPMFTGIYDPNVTTAGSLPQISDYQNPNTETRIIRTPIGVFSVTPNFRVLPRDNPASSQSEIAICRHPLNPNIMFGSSNAVHFGPLFISEGVYVTTNGGVNWYGSDTLNGSPLGNHGGDPGPTIDKNGTIIMSHLGYTTSGMYANYSTDNGLTWSNTFTIATGSQDKNFAGTDDAPSSPYYGRSYVVWSLFNVGSPPIAISYTTNSGVSWSPTQQINTSVAGHYSQGCDIRVGPNGEAYVVWAAPNTGAGNIEDFCGFAKSTNGGVNWTVVDNQYDMNGIRGTFPSKSGIRVNSFPRIDVDRSGGSRNGWIYVATSGKNIVPAGSDPDILLHKSTNGGLNWSSGVRVNQDPLNNGKFQWFPAIRVDEAGGVNIVYYDDRNTASDSAEVWMSRSIDGGNTWTDIQVSDHRHKPVPISGLAGGYQGDYIGITSGNSKVWPLWADNSTNGNYQTWTAPIQITTYPLNAFSLQTPAAGFRIVSYPNSSTPSNFTWDTSASTASYKWIFGNPTPTPRKITLPTTGNSLMVTAGQLDNLLAGLGVAQGDSLVGQWDVWAFRNSSPDDSLKAANGPRTITLKRGIPPLTAFNLSSPPSGTTIQTTPTDLTTVKPNWTRSGQGVVYKWKYAVPNFSNNANVKAIYVADNNGFDTLVSIRRSKLDSLAASLGAGTSDSISGQWRVYAYSANDSLSSTQTYDLRIRRLPITNVTIGTGTADESYPLNRFYNYFRWQGIYLGSEINVTGNIMKIRFYQNNSVSGVTNENLRVFMKSTPDQLLPTGTWDTVGMTMVYSGTLGASLASPGWMEIQLSAPFAFNPSQNLMIGIGRDFQQYVSAYPRFAYSSTSANYRSRRAQSDTQYPTSLTQSFNRANIQLEISLITGVSSNFESIPQTFSLLQNYPNPFNPVTKINYSLPTTQYTILKVYDVLGKEIVTLVNEKQNAGSYSVDFDASNFASGVYFYKIEAGEFSDIKRMMLIK